MRITTKGQVTIPIEIREELGLLPETGVTFQVEGNTVRIVKIPDDGGRLRVARVVANARGRAGAGLSTDPAHLRRGLDRFAAHRGR